LLSAQRRKVEKNKTAKGIVATNLLTENLLFYFGIHGKSSVADPNAGPDPERDFRSGPDSERDFRSK
jgi:hypothetical protein